MFDFQRSTAKRIRLEFVDSAVCAHMLSVCYAVLCAEYPRSCVHYSAQQERVRSGQLSRLTARLHSKKVPENLWQANISYKQAKTSLG